MSALPTLRVAGLAALLLACTLLTACGGGDAGADADTYTRTVPVESYDPMAVASAGNGRRGITRPACAASGVCQ
jgi:hypothetical protein